MVPNLLDTWFWSPNEAFDFWKNQYTNLVSSQSYFAKFFNSQIFHKIQKKKMHQKFLKMPSVIWIENL